MRMHSTSSQKAVSREKNDVANDAFADARPSCRVALPFGDGAPRERSKPRRVQLVQLFVADMTREHHNCASLHFCRKLCKC